MLNFSLAAALVLPCFVVSVDLSFLIFAYICASAHLVETSPGKHLLFVHVLVLKSVLERSCILQIGYFAIIKLHEYEDSCSIPMVSYS